MKNPNNKDCDDADTDTEKMQVIRMVGGGPQRAKNPVSVSALLTGKILRVRKIFVRMVYNVSLKGPILSRQCKSHPDNKTVQMISILSGQF